MKKAIILLAAVILFSGLSSVAAENNKSAAGKEKEVLTAKIITDFYNKKCDGKDSCKTCYVDYHYSKGDTYYCLIYNKNDENKVTGKENCDKTGTNCSKVEDTYTFNKKGKLSSFLYWYDNGGLTSVNIKYCYDRQGRIKREKEKDKSTSSMMGDTVVTYKYKEDKQTQTISERRLDFPPIIKRDKVLEKTTTTCKEDSCMYAQSFLPQLGKEKK